MKNILFNESRDPRSKALAYQQILQQYITQSDKYVEQKIKRYQHQDSTKINKEMNEENNSNYNQSNTDNLIPDKNVENHTDLKKIL